MYLCITAHQKTGLLIIFHHSGRERNQSKYFQMRPIQDTVLGNVLLLLPRDQTHQHKSFFFLFFLKLSSKTTLYSRQNMPKRRKPQQLYNHGECYFTILQYLMDQDGICNQLGESWQGSWKNVSDRRCESYPDAKRLWLKIFPTHFMLFIIISQSTIFTTQPAVLRFWAKDLQVHKINI